MPITKSRPRFDKLSFVRYMKNIGRAYRKQATELVSICRLLVQAQEQTPASDAELRNVLEFVDDALKSATEAGKKSSEEADSKFEIAIRMLSDYQREFHRTRPISDVRERMAEARANDESASTILSRLKERFRPIERQQEMTVEFLIHESLPDKSPTSVNQVLCEQSGLGEILWNFSRFKDEKKRLRLGQHPQFYETLPTLPKEYGAEFRRDPTETFLVEKVCVLMDKRSSAGRVFLETARNKRAFGNAWIPNNAIIFKDVCGKLEGESIVGRPIRDTPDLWCFKEPPRSPTLLPTLSPDRSSPLPSTTGTSTPSAEGSQIKDWRKPIHEMLEILKYGHVDTNIRITAKPPRPSNTGHSYSAPSSPIPQLPSGGSDGSLIPIVHSKSLPPTLQITISAPPAGPPTPSIYRTAPNTPLSERSPVAGLPPSITASPLPRESSISIQQVVMTASPSQLCPQPPSQPPMVALPLTGQATPIPTIARTPSDIFREPESRDVALPEAAPCSTRVPTAEVPSPGTLNAISREVRMTSGPYVADHTDGIDGQRPVPVPDTYPGYTQATGPQQADLTPPDQEPAVVSQPRAPKRKRNWVQKYIVDPCKKLSGSIHRVNSSTPDSAGH